MRKLKELSSSEKSEILNHRKSGMIEKEILKKYDISRRQYYNLLNCNNIVRNSKVNKYKFNENYFEKIDTEDKAYFLGFIVADGCIGDKTNTISIIQKETFILYEFKKYTNSEGNVFTSKSRNISSFGLSSAKTKSDLEKLGIHSNKTMVVKYPNIPDNLHNHFMRGVFDGDGCISLRTDKRDNSQRGQVNICSGSYDFIKEYYDKLVEFANLSGKNKIRCPKGTYYVIDWGGLTDIENIYYFLYKDANVFLERKKKTFDKAVSISKEKIKYRK